MNYKLTLDSKLDVSYSASMAVLKRWLAEGKVQLFDATSGGTRSEPAYGWPGAPPKPPAQKRFKPKPSSKDNVTFREVAAVLFPHQDSQKLNLGEINGVAHMVRHLGSKNEFFVTANLQDFILNGKRDRLKGSFGAIAVTPDEAVQLLSELNGWK